LKSTSISGFIQSLSIFIHFGVNHFAIVTLSNPQFDKSKGSCTDHFPKVFSPTSIALLYSLRAHEVISEADAEFQLTKITIFQSYISQVFKL
jgi:hypothetical protein